MQQIQQLEMQKHAFELHNTQDQTNDNMPQNNHQNNFSNNNFGSQNFPMGDYDQNYNHNRLYGSESGDNYQSNNSMSGNENSYDSQTFEQVTSHRKHDEREEIDLSNLPNINFSQPPPGFETKDNSALLAFQNGLPDLSKPPPGFPPFPEVATEELMPSVPYFDLPAGLMVPLIMVSFVHSIIYLHNNCDSFLYKTLHISVGGR